MVNSTCQFSNLKISTRHGGLENGLGFYREALVRSNAFRRRGVTFWPLFSASGYMGRVRHLEFICFSFRGKISNWHQWESNPSPVITSTTRNPLDSSSDFELRDVTFNDKMNNLLRVEYTYSASYYG